ncbi:hypothetical protein [Escherichia coli]|uniref:rolling circle replication-associated protein n=2 Tax=Escherichia coli TaxID=562 RepID=UPI0020910CEA|nr:hypothetical protein [Escherichia coli]
MATLKLYHNGLTAGIPPMKNNHVRAKRGEVKGWSPTASRNNTKFLRSVHVPDLTGAAVAFTLTIRDCPPNSEDWKKLREAFVVRLRRAGMVRLHWLTEWQRRGVPHLHGIAYFPDAYEPSTVIWNWIAVAEKYGCNMRSQHVVPITDMQGWFMYLAKHAGRSETHYQRNPEFVPAGWAKTGRVWGYCGDWPVDKPVNLETSHKAFCAFRRICRGWRKADARTSNIGNRSRRILSARRMLKCNDRRKSEVRGVSEWIPLDLSLTAGYWCMALHPLPEVDDSRYQIEI